MIAEIAEIRYRQTCMAVALAEFAQDQIRRIRMGEPPLSNQAQLDLLLTWAVRILAIADQVDG